MAHILTRAHYYMNKFSTRPSSRKKQEGSIDAKTIHNRHKIRMPLIYRLLSPVLIVAAASLVLDIYASPVTPKSTNYDRENGG